LNLVVRMEVRLGTGARGAIEEEHGNIHIALISPDEVVRAPAERQFASLNSQHDKSAPFWCELCVRVPHPGSHFFDFGPTFVGITQPHGRQEPRHELETVSKTRVDWQIVREYLLDK
jgi:hypothetical protein